MIDNHCLVHYLMLKEMDPIVYYKVNSNLINWHWLMFGLVMLVMHNNYYLLAVLKKIDNLLNLVLIDVAY